LEGNVVESIREISLWGVEFFVFYKKISSFSPPLRELESPANEQPIWIGVVVGFLPYFIKIKKQRTKGELVLEVWALFWSVQYTRQQLTIYVPLVVRLRRVIWIIITHLRDNDDNQSQGQTSHPEYTTQQREIAVSRCCVVYWRGEPRSHRMSQDPAKTEKEQREILLNSRILLRNG